MGGEAMPKFTQKGKITKAFLTKKNKEGGFTLPGITAGCKYVVIKTMWYW